MSRARSPSEIAPARIPKITDLRKKLAYGDGGLARCLAFIDDLRLFRRRYTAAGLRGIDLWDWRLPQHQEALKQMTTCFLDQHGNGEVYWPSDPTAANFNSLQYSTDRTFITQTMRQLIFRLNLQQHRNAKYKKKEHQPVHEVIDPEDEQSNSRPDLSESNEETLSLSTATPNLHQTHASAHSIAEAPTAVPDPFRQDHDVYDVPTSPEYIPEGPSITKRKLKAPSRISPQKRSKIVSLKIGARKPSIPYLRPIAPMPKRKSPREKTRVAPANYIDSIDLDQFETSPISTTESTLGLDEVIGAEHQSQASVRQQSEDDDVVFSHMRATQPPIMEEGMRPSIAELLRRAQVDHNIDPNLERTSSPVFPMDPPTHRGLHQSIPNRFNCPSPHMNRFQPEAEEPPSPARSLSISTIESTHRTSKTPASLYLSPVPSDARKPAEQAPEAFPTTVSRPVAAPSPDLKASINFHYQVILSRTPVYQAKNWLPKGRFLEKSLSELIKELPFGHKESITGLVIQLTGPGVGLEQTIMCGEKAVSDYNIVKKEFANVATMCLKNHVKARTGSELVMKFELEAVREGVVEEDEEDDVGVLSF